MTIEQNNTGDKLKTISMWEEYTEINQQTILNKNIDVDILIIGGGITGLSTAYHLKDSPYKVALVERNTIASGVSAKTTGKLNYLQENYSKIEKYHRPKRTKLYYESQIDAIRMVTNIIKNEKINCNLEKVDAYLTNNNEKKFKDAKKTLSKLKIGYQENANGIYVTDTFIFHPLKYLFGLKKICLDHNINIYENTKIIKIKKTTNGYLCQTPNHSIKAQKVVFAVHYPYFIYPYFFPLKSKIETSYIAAYPQKKINDYTSITVSTPSLSQRYFHDNNTKYHIVLKSSLNNIRKDAKIVNSLKKDNPDYLWSNNDIITNDFLPIIGILKQNLYIATGYNTWGMTNGSLAGKILADLILQKENRYEKLFNPKRHLNLGKIINTPLFILSAFYFFLKSKTIKKSGLNIKYATRNGNKIAIYTDENNIKHSVYTTCPHLKCTLLFNHVEKTWDCPCHGSRFDLNGNAIKGPSNYNISYKGK